MRLIIALILWVIGAGIMVYGIGGALMELVSLYQGALSDPLGETAADSKTVSAGMIQNLVVGAAGIPFLLVGTLMIRSHWSRRRRGRR